MKKNQLKKKLKGRKLTKNEKILLTILGTIVVLMSVYRFVIEPQKTKLSDLTDKKIEYEEQIAQINEVLRNEENIDKEWTSLHREKDLILSKYFPNLNQPEIIYLLNELLVSEDIHILDMSFSTPSEELIGDLSVRTMDITIPYRGSYKGLTDIIKGIESSPKKILISNLIVDRDMNGELVGNIGLKLYSLEGIADIDEELAYIDTGIIEGKTNPFVAFEGYKKEEIEEDLEKEEVDSTGSVYTPNTGEEIVDNYQSELLEDFEDGGLYFIPSHKNIEGRVSKSSNSKSKKHSLRLEYNILAVEEENRAYIDLTDRNIFIKYPPENIGLWVYSHSYSPVTLGLRFKGQAGEKIDVELSKGINWIGWDYIEANPPQDLSLYPLQLDRIYLELSFNRDDFGVILFDKLEAKYPKDTNKSKEKFTFYIVEKGDTLNKISLKNYGTINKKNLIIKYNDIKTDKDLIEGKILVIPK